jgi:hypothetical protein
MERLKVKSYLEAATNVSVLLVALLVLYVCWASYFTGQSQHVQSEGIKTGKILARIPEHEYSSSPQTLVIALNPQCSFCNESLPFYNRLVKSHNSTDIAPHIIGVSQAPLSEVKQYLQQNHLDIDVAAGVNLSSLNVTATPTMILVNSKGTILNFWVGKLSISGEQEVFKALERIK